MMEWMKAEQDPAIAKLFEDFSKADRINAANLRKILSDNQSTFYGKTHHFSDIHSPEEYRNRVPLTEYPVYAKMWQKPEEFTAYPVPCILATSGTTGVQKKFCITEEALRRYSSYIYELPYMLTEGRAGPHIHMSVFRSAVDGTNLLSAVYHKYLEETGLFDCGAYVGGKELMFSDHITQVAYVKAWLALSCPELISIQAIFLYDVLLLFGYLEEHWRTLLDNMANHTIQMELSETLKEKLLAVCPAAERVRELQAIFSEGFAQPIAGRLWKQLHFISGIGGQMYQFQEEALRKYIGEVPVYYFTYTASECMAGAAIEMGKAQYALLPQSAYYEFLSAQGEIVPLEAVQAGNVYEPVVTTFSGLYRYRMGDRIKVVSFARKSPVFEVVGRVGHISNIAGEKLDEETVRAAVGSFSKQWNLYIADFSLGIDAENVPCGYCLFVETKKQAQKQWASSFDQILRGLCADYDDIRNLEMLACARICVLKNGQIQQVFAQTNERPAHNKPHIFMNPRQTNELLSREIR